MAAVCRWNCSDNYVDDQVNTPIIYTSPTGGKEWLYLRNETGKALYPPPSMGIGPQGFSAYTGVGGRVTFNFLGQEVAVYGTEFDTGTKSSYTLDGEVVSTHTSQGPDLGVVLFHSGVLSSMAHTLVIDVVQASDTSPFTLDWIEYNNTARGTASSMPDSTSPPSQPHSSSPSSPESSSSVSALPVGNRQRPSFSFAAVAGGVVGGCVGLVAIILAWLALRSRRRWRTGGATKYEYGEVARFDSDNPVPCTDITPTISVVPTSIRSVEPSSVSVSTSSRIVLRGSGEHEPGLGNSERELYSDSPPAYVP